MSAIRCSCHIFLLDYVSRIHHVVPINRWTVNNYTLPKILTGKLLNEFIFVIRMSKSGE